MNVALLDTFVAFTSGLIIFPACFSYGIAPDAGPNLLFVTLTTVFSNMSLGWFWGGLFFLFMLLFVVNILFVIPFYSSYGNAFGFVISIIMIWVEIILLLCLPYYFPLMNLLPADRPLKTAKKCFIIVADNLGFTLFYLIYSIICIVISVLTIGLVPGLTGMQLAAQDAMKLLMFKYDYLEENPSADRKHIPWEDLLYDEREKVGPRSLKSMIFPWKY